MDPLSYEFAINQALNMNQYPQPMTQYDYYKSGTTDSNYTSPANKTNYLKKYSPAIGGLLGLGFGLTEGYGKIDQYNRMYKSTKKQGEEYTKLGNQLIGDSIRTGQSLSAQNINNYAIAGRDKEGFYQSLQPQILGTMNQGIGQGRGLVTEGKNLIKEADKYKLSEWEKWNMVLGGGLKGSAGGVNTAMSVLGLFV